MKGLEVAMPAAASKLPDTARLLVAGGDRRLAPEPATGRPVSVPSWREGEH